MANNYLVLYVTQESEYNNQFRVILKCQQKKYTFTTASFILWENWTLVQYIQQKIVCKKRNFKGGFF